MGELLRAQAWLNFDADLSIDYYYTSRLPGEPLAGVEDLHFHPALPRTARLALIIGY
jgi:hypothetical protein